MKDIFFTQPGRFAIVELLVISGLLCFGCARPAHAAAILIQSSTVNYTNVTSSTCPLSPTAAGDLLVVMYRTNFQALSGITFSDSNNDVFIKAATSSNAYQGVAYAYNVAAGNASITAMFPSNFMSMSCFEFSGIRNNGDPFDGGNIAQIFTPTSTYNSNSITTAGSSDLILSQIGPDTASITPSAPFSLLLTNHYGGPGWITYTLKASGISPGTYTSTGTVPSPAMPSVNIIAFREITDIAPPSVVWITPAAGTISGSVMLTVSSTDNVAVQSVSFYNGGTLIGSTSTAIGTQYSMLWDTTGAANGSTTLSALSMDTSGNTSTAAVAVTIKNPPTISLITVSTASTTATIAWNTNSPASSQFNYGVSSLYGSSTATSSLLTTHSIAITGLTPSTTYHCQIVATDAGGNQATTSDFIFRTSQLYMSITYVQKSRETFSELSPIQISFPSGTTAGNAIVIYTGWASVATTPDNVTDTLGNVFMVATGTLAKDLTNGISAEVLYALNIEEGTDTITLAFSSGRYNMDAIAVEYAGVATSSALDRAATSSFSGNSLIVGPVSTVNDGELVVGGFTDNTGVGTVYTAGDGYTGRSPTSGPAAYHFYEDQVRLSAGSVALMASSTGFIPSLGTMATFNPVIIPYVPPPVVLSPSIPDTGKHPSVSVAAGYNVEIPAGYILNPTSTPVGSLGTSTVEVLRSQIALLQNKLSDLRSRLEMAGGTSPQTFTRFLSLWDTGSDVKSLQQVLIARNRGPAARTLAKHGATFIFGYLTLRALEEYQYSVGLPPTGYFGPMTKGIITMNQ